MSDDELVDKMYAAIGELEEVLRFLPRSNIKNKFGFTSVIARFLEYFDSAAEKAQKK